VFVWNDDNTIKKQNEINYEAQFLIYQVYKNKIDKKKTIKTNKNSMLNDKIERKMKKLF
jgi:hypothetical protein